MPFLGEGPAVTQILCWMKVVRVGITVLFLIRGGFQLFTFAYDSNCVFVMYAVYYVMCPLSILPFTYFVENFYHKWMLNLSNTFLYLFSWYFNPWICWCFLLTDSDIEPSLQLWKKSPLTMVYVFSWTVKSSLLKLWEFLYLCSSGILACSLFYSIFGLVSG